VEFSLAERSFACVPPRNLRGRGCFTSASTSQATTTIILPSEIPNPKQEYLPTYQAKMTQWATENADSTAVTIRLWTDTPTRGPIRTPYPTATVPQQTLAVQSTLKALVTRNPDLEQPNWTAGCTAPNCYRADGLWAAFLLTRTEIWEYGIKIISTDGAKQWDIYYSELSGETCPCGESYVYIKHWSRGEVDMCIFIP
jgi:hypothetical protein